MEPLKAAILIVLPALIIMTMLGSTTYAITGNYKPDSTPYVGIVVLFSDSARQQPISYSTGILISPTLVLTAGHSIIGGVAASVCFDQGPISYSLQNGQIAYSGNAQVYNGFPFPYPEYASAVVTGAANGNQIFSVSDIGLIVLDKPVEGITNFATLPKAGFVDTLPMKSDLQVVGYGVQYQVTPKNNGPANSWTGTLSRNSAQVQLLSNNFQGSDKYIRCTANPAQDKGGIAFGDSGGPVIYNTNSQNLVIAVNAYVNSANCNGITYHARVDTPQVLAWINGFLEQNVA